MILEAIGVVAASVTVITVASLRLVSVVDKREREDDEAEDVQIRPFEDVVIGTLCPICGRPGKNASMPFGAEGPSVPTVCSAHHKCDVRRSHLHVTCRTCGGSWLMATADSVDKAS